MSMSVLVEKTIVTNNYSTVNFASSNLSNSISGRKNGASYSQIGQFLLKLAEFQILNSKFQLKKLLLLMGGRNFSMHLDQFERTQNLFVKKTISN
jgi:hypothetical protein